MVHNVQKDLVDTAEALETHRHNLAEKERLLRSRDALLESAGLESKKLSDLLDAERAARRRERLLYENSARGHQAHRTTLAAHEARVLELETQKGVDKKKIAYLEHRMREQLSDRHNLLLALWTRLSTLCGADWTKNHALIDGENPSLEVLSKNLPGFSQNIILAVKTVEGLVSAFRQRVRQVEKDLWRDFQTLEHALDVRTKRLEGVEAWVKNVGPNSSSSNTSNNLAPVRPPVPSRTSSSRSGVGGGGGPSSSSRHTEEIAKLKGENKILKAELQFVRQTSPTSPHQQRHNHPASSSSSQPSPSSPTATRDTAARLSVASTLLRHHSTSAVEMLQAQQLHAQQEASNGSDYLRPQHHQQHQQSTGFPHVVAARDAGSGGGGGGGGGGGAAGPHGRPRSMMMFPSAPIQPSEQRWIHRLKELERRLKAEREARLLDRSGARKRLEEGRAENEELRMLLEREKVRRGSVVLNEEEEDDDDVDGEEQGQGQGQGGLDG